MAVTQLQIGKQVANDGTPAIQRGDNYGNTTMQMFNGKYAELTRRGQLFHCSVKTAAAYLLTNTSGNCPTIWNPAGSNKIVYILGLMSTWLSGATTAGALQWAVTTPAGSNIGTGAPVVTFTNQAPDPGLIGSSAACVCRFAPAVCTFTAAPSYYISSGVSLKAAATDYVIQVDYDGAIALMPNTAASLVYSVTTSTSLNFTDIIIAELDMPGGVV
jgi:hypothetical protein